LIKKFCTHLIFNALLEQSLLFVIHPFFDASLLRSTSILTVVVGFTELGLLYRVLELLQFGPVKIDIFLVVNNRVGAQRVIVSLGRFDKNLSQFSGRDNAVENTVNDAAAVRRGIRLKISCVRAYLKSSESKLSSFSYGKHDIKKQTFFNLLLNQRGQNCCITVVKKLKYFKFETSFYLFDFILPKVKYGKKKVTFERKNIETKRIL
ncbi:hypothetical protein BpHYR1_026210, partial [Brachionus plicatilis]